jgi:quercetin dioxygenase-like cupin family protein
MPFIDPSALEVWEPLPGWKGRFFHSDNMTFAYYSVSAGSSIHEHSHPQEEVWNVIEGEFAVTIDGATQVAMPGSAAVVPSNTMHSAKALTDGRVIVVDYPLRHMAGGHRR